MSYALSFKAGKCFVGSSADKAVLRCLCDYANDDGSSCRPATSTISAETELNKKTVYKSLSSLSQDGWIEVSSLNGRQNFYTINVTKIEEAFIETTAGKRQTSTNFGTTPKFGTGTKNGSGSSTKNGTKTSTNFGTSTKNGLEPVPKTVHNSVNTQSIINTSKDVFVDRAETGSTDERRNDVSDGEEFNLTEPKEELTQKQRAKQIGDRCPHEKIISLYHEILPTLPPVRIWSEKRKQALSARWKQLVNDKEYQSEADGLGWFRRFFGYISQSAFLMGETTQKEGYSWRPDLEWIVTQKNFIKICEGKYHGNS